MHVRFGDKGSNSDILVMVQRAQNKSLRIYNKFQGRESAPLYTETKILDLTNIITIMIACLFLII